MELREGKFITSYLALPIPPGLLEHEGIRRLLHDKTHSFIMTIDTTYRGGKKHTYIGLEPQRTFKLLKHQRNFIFEVNDKESSNLSYDVEKFLEKNLLLDQQRPSGLPPFYGGLFGYIGYEMVERWEELYHNDRDKGLKTTEGLPILYMGLFDELLCIDHEDGKLFLIKTFPEEEIENALASLFRKASSLTRSLSKNTPLKVERESLYLKGFSSNVSKKEFLSMVEQAKEHIKAGEAFQIVISQRFSFESNIDPLDLFFSLMEKNPSPYMFFINFPEIKLIGASPEVLVEVKGNRVITRPLAGTRRKGKSPEENERLKEELIKDVKERAEHVMLVDLGRNDLGKICEPGSVTVSELMKVESYPHVMHIASQVEGKLSKGVAPFDVLRAVFPAGTVTGAPKVRAMELINDMERDPRGPYAGSVGYISFCGDMEMCITIRTIYFYDGRFHIQVGAGIVSDSNPETEYRETIYKAMGLFKAVKALFKNVQQVKESLFLKEG